MRFRAYDTDNGAFLAFFGDRFENDDFQARLGASESVYAILVFFQNEGLLEIIGACVKVFPRPIICYCGSRLPEIYAELLQLMHCGYIRSVIIPPSLVYSGCELNELDLGYECWSENGTPGGLKLLDAGAFERSDLSGLPPYVENVVDELLSYHPVNDLERILLLDVWFQRNIQYIIGEKTKTGKGIYICHDMQGRESRAVDVLSSHFGRCEDIAFTASLILNNPRLGIRCRQVGSASIGHSWNIVQCDGLEYYCDFTHNITRNPDQVLSAVKARSYCHDHTFLGLDKAYHKYGSTDAYENAQLAEHSIDNHTLEAAMSNLASKGVLFAWGDSVVKESSFIPVER